MAMSETALKGTNTLCTMALDLGIAVLSEQAPTVARRYLGLIAELGPNVYKPKPGELELALDLATVDMEGAVPNPALRLNDYLFFRDIASKYGLNGKVEEYNGKIAALETSRK